MLAGWAVVKLVFAVFHVHTSLRVVELLPEQLLGYALLFGALALVLRVQYERPFWRSLAWAPFGFPPLFVVLCGVLTSLSVALLGSLIHTPTTSNPMMELLQGRTSTILMAIFGIGIAPVCEELAFRGFFQPLLVRSMGPVPGVIVAAIPFGLLHYREFGNSWRHAVLIALAGTTLRVDAPRHRIDQGIRPHARLLQRADLRRGLHPVTARDFRAFSIRSRSARSWGARSLLPLSTRRSTVPSSSSRRRRASFSTAHSAAWMLSSH